MKYDPATDLLEGEATIRARATQNLSRFNLDLEGLTVDEVEVNGRRATWTRDGGELIITPREGLRDRKSFNVEVEYHGTPEPIVDLFGLSGFIPTDDGAVIVGQPHVADYWYPGERPPERQGRVHVQGDRSRGPRSGGERRPPEPPDEERLDDLDVGREGADGLLPDHGDDGQFDLRAYRDDGIKFWDAVDPDLYAPTGAPRTGAAVRHLAGEPTVVQASGPHDRGAGRRGDDVLLDQARHRAELGLRRSWRRTRSARTIGGRFRISTATRARTPGSCARSGTRCTRS